MERAVALKKLRKLIGKGFGYQIDPKAPTSEMREAAKRLIKPAVAERDELSKKCAERRRVILEADAEYQKLMADYGEVRKKVDALNSTLYRQKISVGTSNALFFHVKASGDSWEEVIEKLQQK